MSFVVCLAADTIGYPEGGGHFWAYLNWALALEAAGCKVIWLEAIARGTGDESAAANAVRERLQPYGLGGRLAIYSPSETPLAPAVARAHLDLDAAAEADLLLNFRYSTPANVVQRFRRSAVVDIDPGLLQTWVAAGCIQLARHDVHFTTGERVGGAGSPIPDCGLAWDHTVPCVALDWWPTHAAPRDAPFTTVSQWFTEEWFGGADGYPNDKRSGFLPFLDLPRHTREPLELALCLGPDEEDERAALQQRGWRVRDAEAVASTPWQYQSYIQHSRGEFSCAKPSCVRLQAGWTSDRTLCYLASGKPAVVQHTGPSRVLPDEAGVFRFRDLAGAVRAFERIASDYGHQCRLARALAEEHFDGKAVVRRVLERALA